MQMESEMKREGSVGTPRNRKVLGQSKVEKNDFPREREVQEKKFKSNLSVTGTQTQFAKIRKCRLIRSSVKGILMAQSFCRVSTATVKAMILQQTTREGIMKGVGRTVAQLTAKINTSHPLHRAVQKLCPSDGVS